MGQLKEGTHSTTSVDAICSRSPSYSASSTERKFEITQRIWPDTSTWEPFEGRLAAAHTEYAFGTAARQLWCEDDEIEAKWYENEGLGYLYQQKAVLVIEVVVVEVK